jgi:hypothetical protein
MISCSNEDLKTLDWDIIPNYKKINISIIDYCIKNEKEYIDLYASNYSAKLDQDKLLVDFDRDGLPNSYDSDEKYAISPLKYDTNQDGYRDLLVYLSGIDIENQQYLKICDDFEQDTDKDGLTDCEENNFIRSDPNNFDTDNDGIPDELEIMNNLNPNDPNDAYQDLDDDGIINSEEVRLHTPINLSNNKNLKKLEYQYNVSLSKLKLDSRCYNININNISLVDVKNGNLIKFNIIEKLIDQKNMRTFRIIIEYDKVDDNEVLEYDFKSLVEGV